MFSLDFHRHCAGPIFGTRGYESLTNSTSEDNGGSATVSSGGEKPLIGGASLLGCQRNVVAHQRASRHKPLAVNPNAGIDSLTCLRMLALSDISIASKIGLNRRSHRFHCRRPCRVQFRQVISDESLPA
jgi:hypothetical protein